MYNKPSLYDGWRWASKEMGQKLGDKVLESGPTFWNFGGIKKGIGVWTHLLQFVVAVCQPKLDLDLQAWVLFYASWSLGNRNKKLREVEVEVAKLGAQNVVRNSEHKLTRSWTWSSKMLPRIQNTNLLEIELDVANFGAQNVAMDLEYKLTGSRSWSS